MKLLLVRDAGGADFTFGKLYVNGVIECDTLEDRDRELEKAGCKAKVMAATAIPRGTYPVTVNVSARFKKRLPLLVDVPCFQGIRIHSGNFAGKETFVKTINIDTLKAVFLSEEYIEVCDDKKS